MQTRLTLKSGQKGTKRLLAEYGDCLVCVRYRYDAQKKKRYKTVELIVEEMDWCPRPKRTKGNPLAEIKVNWGEPEIARRVKQAGGQWNAQKKVWELRYDQVVKLELEKRIVGYLNVDTKKSI
ncbi:MAG: hypothetical protein HY868_03505 [Chloroflexi bacterium]|nr:hypothetical protein [Chloroflexota bacterium]